MKNKGKVHPCTTSSSSSSSSSASYSPNDQSSSVLKLLPAAVFSLISALSAADREVLAYMMTRSLKSTNPSFFSPEIPKTPPKKQSSDHKSFDCGCFDCYTGFWLRWDSSPNRELIHQAIEAFEEHLSSGERERKSGSGRNRRREKIGRRRGGEMSGGDGGGALREGSAVGVPEIEEDSVGVPAEEVEEKGEGAGAGAAVGHGRRGLARRVLPDVMGIFNSRLWSLWGPEL